MRADAVVGPQTVLDQELRRGVRAEDLAVRGFVANLRDDLLRRVSSTRHLVRVSRSTSSHSGWTSFWGAAQSWFYCALGTHLASSSLQDQMSARLVLARAHVRVTWPVSGSASIRISPIGLPSGRDLLRSRIAAI